MTELLLTNQTQADLESKGIKIGKYTLESVDLATETEVWVLNYHMTDSPRNDPLVKQCRSLIVAPQDDGSYEVVSRCMDRFFNYGEPECPEIDWSTVWCKEKIDGSLIKLYSLNEGGWRFATRSVPDAALANVQGLDLTFEDLCFDALGLPRGQKGIRALQDLCDVTLDPVCTYIFELVSPYTQLVVRHSETALYYLAVRRHDGVYLQEEEGEKPYGFIHSTFGSLVRYPQVYRFNTIKDILAAAKALPNLEEGYVVWSRNGPIAKIKNPAYVAAHHLKTEGFSHKGALHLVVKGEYHEYAALFPAYADMLRRYVDIWDTTLAMAKSLYEEFKHIPEQRDYALAVKDFVLSDLLFKARKLGSFEKALSELTDLKKVNLLNAALKARGIAPTDEEEV